MHGVALLPALPLAVFEELLQLRVLVLAQEAAHAKQHERPRFAQGGSRPFDAIDERRQFSLFDLGLGHHHRQLVFELVEGPLLRPVCRPGFFENAVEARDLVGREGELALEVIVLPPLESLAGSRKGSRQDEESQSNKN